MTTGGIITIIILILLAGLGFFLYFVFKQVQFILQAVNLYKDMIARQDMMIRLLKDIRERGGLISHDMPVESPLTLSDESQQKSIDESKDTEEDLQKLRNVAGQDAIQFAHVTETEWICVCGTHNPLDKTKQIQTCSNCRKNRDLVIEKFSLSSIRKM